MLFYNDARMGQRTSKNTGRASRIGLDDTHNSQRNDQPVLRRPPTHPHHSQRANRSRWSQPWQHTISKEKGELHRAAKGGPLQFLFDVNNPMELQRNLGGDRSKSKLVVTNSIQTNMFWTRDIHLGRFLRNKVILPFAPFLSYPLDEQVESLALWHHYAGTKEKNIQDCSRVPQRANCASFLPLSLPPLPFGCLCCPMLTCMHMQQLNKKETWMKKVFCLSIDRR